MRWSQRLVLLSVVALTIVGSHAMEPSPPPPPELPPPSVPFIASPDDAEMRLHADDVADYTLRARLDPTHHTVHGEGTIRFVNTSSLAVQEIWIHLYLNAFKNERSAFLREPAGGFRGSSALKDWGTIDVRSLSVDDDGKAVDLWPRAELKHKSTDAEADARTEDDETDARVPLLHPLAPGEVLTMEVVWDDKLPTIVERTGYYGSFHFVGQWFPKVARLEPNGAWAHFPFHHLAEFYADYGTYDVTLDVPDGFRIGATGPVVESHHEQGRTIERHVQEDIHDFAWTAWDGFQERHETIAGVAVSILYPRGFERDADREIKAMRFALPYFGARYGAYPYPVLTLVHPVEGASEAGGMEYPTLITTGGAWYGPPRVNLPELVTIHEFGHQYFYGLVGSNEVLWPFLDEGVNSFAEQDAMREFLGAGSAVNVFGLSIGDDTIQAVLGNLAQHDEPVAQPAYAFSSGARYSELVYNRTAATVETIARVYGHDTVRRALGQYARRFRYGHPGPEDFIAAFEGIAQGDASANLRKALFDKGWVDYSVDEVVCHPGVAARGIFDRDGQRETVRDARAEAGEFDGWVLLHRRGTLSMPVEVEMRLADGSRQRVKWDGRGDDVRLAFHGKTALLAAIVDPDHRVLLDSDLTNNHASADAVPASQNRVLDRAAYWGALLVQAVTP